MTRSRIRAAGAAAAAALLVLLLLLPLLRPSRPRAEPPPDGGAPPALGDGERRAVPPGAAVPAALPAGESPGAAPAAAEAPGLRGTVLDGDGRPVSGAKVEATNLPPWPAALTGDDGTFVLRGRPRGYGTHEPLLVTDPGQRFPPWYGRGGDGIVIRLERGARVEGRVLLAGTGEPLEGAEVRVRTAAEWRGLWPFVVSGADGGFALAVPAPGMAILTVRAEGLAPHEEAIDPVPGDVEARTVVLGRGAVIRGRVLDSGGRPVPGAVAALARDLAESHPLFPPGEAARLLLNPESRAALPRTARTDGEGRFVLERVPFGPAHVAVAAPDRLPAVVEAEPYGKGAVAEITVVLGDGAVIEGTVPGPPRAERVLILGNRGVYREVPVGREGTFRAGGLPGGAYGVIAGRITQVEVPDGGTVRAVWEEGGPGTPNLPEPARPPPAPPAPEAGTAALTVVLLGPDGRPAPWAVAAVLDGSGRLVAQAAGSGLALTVPGVPPGVHDVVAATPEGAFARREGVRTAGVAATVRMATGAGGDAAVLVVDGEGRPVGSATVTLRLRGGASLPFAGGAGRMKGGFLALEAPRALSGPDGRVRFGRLSAADYEVSAEAPGGLRGEAEFAVEDGRTTEIPLRVE